MVKTIDIKYAPNMYLEILVGEKKIELSDVTSVTSKRMVFYEKIFHKTKNLDIMFSCPNALERNKEKLSKLQKITDSISEVISPDYIMDYKNIYRMGFPKGKYEIKITI